MRRRHHDGSVFLYAFDLIELNGDDLRRDPLEVRKATLASVLVKAAPGLRLNEHIEADGPIVFAHLPLGTVTRLAQEQESGLCGSEAGGGRGLGAVTLMQGDGPR